LRRLTGTQTDSVSATYSYDGLDRITSMGDYTDGHDALGNVVTKDVATFSTEGAWSVMNYADPLRPHALTHAAYTDVTRTADYTYDTAGNVRLKTRTGPGSAITNASLFYDSQDRLHRIRVSGGRTTVLRYGALGQRLGTTQWETNGDTDGDGWVGSVDYAAFITQFTQGSEPGATADVNGDLDVNPNDSTIITGQFGQFVDGPSVLEPEPGFEYHTSLHLVNKHFFVEGVRVASSARNWAAPLALDATRHNLVEPSRAAAPAWMGGRGFAVRALSPCSCSVPRFAGARLASAYRRCGCARAPRGRCSWYRRRCSHRPATSSVRRPSQDSVSTRTAFSSTPRTTWVPRS
jgi:hypothetical protein